MNCCLCEKVITNEEIWMLFDKSEAQLWCGSCVKREMIKQVLEDIWESEPEKPITL